MACLCHCRFAEDAVDEYDMLRRIDALNTIIKPEAVQALYQAGQAKATARGQSETDVRGPNDPPCARRHHSMLPLVLQVLHSMADEDLAVRSAAQAAAEGLMRGLAGLIPSDCPSLKEARRTGAWHLVATVIVPAMRTALSDFGAAASRRGIVALFGVLVRLTRDLPACLVEQPILHADLEVLTNDQDAEVDVFINLNHIQLHRRARALDRIRSLLNTPPAVTVGADGDAGEGEGAPSAQRHVDVTDQAVARAQAAQAVCPFTNSSLQHVILPLIMHALRYSARAPNQGQTQSQRRKRKRTVTLCTWSVHAYTVCHAHRGCLLVCRGKPRPGRRPPGCVGLAVSCGAACTVECVRGVVLCGVVWCGVATTADTATLHRYKAVLRQLLGEITSKASQLRPATEKLFMRATGHWIDGFHFKPALEVKTKSSGAGANAGAGAGAGDGDDATNPAVVKRPNAVLTALLRSILPSIQKLMLKVVATRTGHRDQREPTNGKGEKAGDKELRAPMAFCMVKLLCHLPSSMIKLRVPKVIAAVCTSLKSRDQRHRDAARAALVKIANHMGPTRLPVIVEQMVCVVGVVW